MKGTDPDGTQLGGAGEGAGELLHGMEPPDSESDEEANTQHVGVVPQGII
jgi:hypothetical protein